MFASNVQRLKLIGEVAIRARRNIVLLGRSVQLHVQWGHELGWLDWPSDLVVGPEHAAGLSRKRTLVIAGGTQAEPRSALSRLAARAHPALTLTPGDTVVLSSRIIPGNDRAVFDLMADLLRQELIVRSWITDPDVHVSGHAHRKEQERMLDLVRPRAFIPIHGTLHHLVRHAELARERGVSEILVLENGQTARLATDLLERSERFEAEPVATWAGQEIPKEVLRERASLGRAGVVHVTVVIDGDGRLESPPIVTSRGVIGERDQPSAFRAAARAVTEALEARPWRSGRPDDTSLAEVARLAVRRALEAQTGSRPIALVTVVRAKSI
jgi:ribonuclease J